MMTYRALTTMDHLKAAVVGGALSDVRANISDRPEMEEVVRALVPNYAANREAELDKRSAVKWADQLPTSTPILILHGGADWRVKPSQSLDMAAELTKHKIPYRLMIFEGGDHGLSEHKLEVNAAVVNWFDRFLKGREMLPETEFHGE